MTTLHDNLLAAVPSTLVEMYIRLRLKRDAARQVEQETSAKMTLIGSYILAKMKDLGQDGFKAVGFTVFKTTLTSAKVVEREAFFDFIKTAQAYDLLEARVSKEAAQTFLAENGVPIPGVQMDEITRLSVRKG